MPDHILPAEFELKLEEISMKIFENTTKKHRSRLRTTYRTSDLTKLPNPPKQFDFTDSYTYTSFYENQMLMNLSELANFRINETITQHQRPLESSKSKKKSVRFADSLGLALDNIYEILLYPCEDPNSTVDDSDFSSDSFTDSDLEELDINTFELGNVRSKWQCSFEQPGLLPTFYRDLKAKNVLLETIHANHHVLEGLVKVINVSEFKRVNIRYTLNDWKSFTDLGCEYLKSLNFDSVRTDQFKFRFELDEVMIGELLEENRGCTNGPLFKVQFALCYETFGDVECLEKIETHWDNNADKNYCFECYLQMIS